MTNSILVQLKQGEPVPVEVALNVRTSGPRKPRLSVSFTTDEDSRTARPLPLRRMLLPWADTKADLGKPIELPAAEGTRRRELGTRAEGLLQRTSIVLQVPQRVVGKAAPSARTSRNLIHRDYPSVLRDITQPSFAINPDHIAYVVRLKDDRTLTGVIRTEGNKLHIGDKDAKTVIIDKADVAEMRPSPLSVMPDDLLKKLVAGTTTRPAHVPAHAGAVTCRETTPAPRSGRSRAPSRK